MKDWIRLEQNEYVFFIPRHNIAGISINKNKPKELSILMCGDAETASFAFADTTARNAKLNEILEVENLTNSTEE